MPVVKARAICLNPKLKGPTKEEAPYGGFGASSSSSLRGVMGGKTITNINSNAIYDMSRDIFLGMVKVNETGNEGLGPS